MQKKGFLKLFFRISITAVLLAVVLYKVKLPDFSQAMMDINWLAVAGMWLLSALFLWINSYKMQIILSPLDCSVTLKTLIATTAITTLYSLVLPGFASSGVKWYILKKDTGQGGRIFSSMIYNQASELFVVVILGMLGIALTNFNLNSKITYISLAVILLMMVVFLWLVYIKDTKKIRRIIGWPIAFLPKRIIAKTTSILDQLHIFQRQNLSFHIKVFLITFLSFIGSVAAYVLAAEAVNIHVPPAILVWQCALIYLLGKLPISVGNLGVREITLVEVLKTYNVEPSDAFLMSMLLFTNVLLIAIIGAFCQIFCKFNNRNGVNS